MQIVAWIALVLANRRIVQNKVVENAAVEIGHETADLKQEVLTKAELQSLFMIVLHQLIEKLLILLLEADLAGANVEPLDIVLGEEGVNGGSRAPCLATRFADEELNLLLGTNSKGLVTVKGLSCSLSLLLQEAREKAASIMKAILQSFIVFIFLFQLLLSI